MTTLENAEVLASSLSRSDKARLVLTVNQDLRDGEPAIRRTPGVCGGRACIRKTRIAVWILEEARRLGVTDADLLYDYPGLDAQDLASAWAYVSAFPDEIAGDIRDNDMTLWDQE